MNWRVRHGVAIVGAGVVGSAVAYALAERGVKNVEVFDPDLGGELSSTERNAGGVRHLWMHSINSELSRLSIRYFESVQAEVGFLQTGYLWLYSQNQSTLGVAALKLANERGLDYEELSPSDITNQYPFIDKTDDIAFGIKGRKDGILNSNRLKSHLQSRARALGVFFHDRQWVTGIDEQDRVTLFTSELNCEADAHRLLRSPLYKLPSPRARQFDAVVLTAGAWTSTLLEACGIPKITRPIRRQIATFKAENLDLAPYGMIVDTSGVYFHAEGGNLLAGLVLKDEPEGYQFQVDSDFFESHIWPALHSRSTSLERLKATGGWGGLYSYTPDITGILGRVPGFKNVFESHSYTGHGVMHSIGAAGAISELIVDGKFVTIDAACLSRDRFKENRLLHETLHI